MRATKCEIHTTHRMMRNGLALIIHSCAIIVPRGVWFVNIAGRRKVLTIRASSPPSRR